MPRDLRSRLILAFALVSGLGLSLLAALVFWYGRQTYVQLKAQQVQVAIENSVSLHYQLYGTLAGLAPQEKPLGESTSARPSDPQPPAPPPGPAPRPQNRGTPPKAAPPRPPADSGTTPGLPPFLVLDPAFRVAASVPGYSRGRLILEQARVDLRPVQVNGQTVAYLLPTGTAPRLDAASSAFLRRGAAALVLVTLLVALLAILMGAALARQLLLPLQSLQGGVRALTRGEPLPPLPTFTTSELAELALAFNAMTAELERRRVAGRQFSADIAHELGTPLGVMRGTLDAMQDGTLPVTPERLARLQKQLTQVAHLTGDLRLLSLADAGDLSLKRRAVQVDAFLDDVVQAFQERMVEADLHVTLQTFPVTVQADPIRLTQIMNNLIENAVHHTPPGGVITLTASRNTPETIVITVEDTGSGIPASQLPLVFDRLYRADPSRHAPGSGLGLSIARTLAQAHGGTLSLSSSEGQGTVAALTLPSAPLTR